MYHSPGLRWRGGEEPGSDEFLNTVFVFRSASWRQTCRQPAPAPSRPDQFGASGRRRRMMPANRGRTAMTTLRALVAIVPLVCATAQPARADEQISDWQGTTVRLQEGDVLSGGVRIHYHTAGEGPLLVLVHGIGGFWFDWRHQIPALSKQYKVVAMTQRGFDKSDQPSGAENYAAAKIAGDIDALITHFGRDKATIMAFDSGGFHAWYFAMHHPERTERLVAIGSYHPATLVREYATNPAQQKAGSTPATSRSSPMPPPRWRSGCAIRTRRCAPETRQRFTGCGSRRRDGRRSTR